MYNGLISDGILMDRVRYTYRSGPLYLLIGSVILIGRPYANRYTYLESPRIFELHPSQRDFLGSTLDGTAPKVTLHFLVTKKIFFAADCFVLADPDDPSLHMIALQLHQEDEDPCDRGDLRRAHSVLWNLRPVSGAQ